MVGGRLELISTDFALGWTELVGGHRTFVYASYEGEVIGVSEANLSRPDLDLKNASGELNARAYVILFNPPLGEDRMHLVQVGVVGEAEFLPRAASLRHDRSPRLQVLVLGSPRSGTSELGNTLAAKLRLPWLGEGHAAPLFFSASRALSGDAGSNNGLVRFLSTQGYSEIAVEAARRAYYFMHASSSFLDKTPGIPMIEAAPFLLRCFPDSRVIYLMRNGISNVLSRMVKFGGSFEGHCADWAGALESWRRVKSLLPHSLELRQEDMLDNPSVVAKSIAEYLQMPEIVDALIDSLQAGSLERTGAGIGRSRLDQTAWTSDQVQSFRQLCGPAMEENGYPMT
jgi:hypothetical protein